MYTKVEIYIRLTIFLYNLMNYHIQECLTPN